jgi:hypothetical protein
MGGSKMGLALNRRAEVETLAADGERQARGRFILVNVTRLHLDEVDLRGIPAKRREVGRFDNVTLAQLLPPSFTSGDHIVAEDPSDGVVL